MGRSSRRTVGAPREMHRLFSTDPDGIMPPMADQDVANQGQPTYQSPPPEARSPLSGESGKPGPGALIRGGKATGNGTTNAINVADPSPLRAEFADRISAAQAHFSSAIEEMWHAASCMRDDGRPPSYRLIHTLGECHREFLRLRLDLARRAEALGFPVPALDTIGGIGDLTRLLDAIPAEAIARTHGSETEVEALTLTEPAQAVIEPPAPAPQPPDELIAEIVEPEPSPEPPVPEPEPQPVEAPVSAERDETEHPVSAEREESEHPGLAVRQSALTAIETVLRLNSRDGEDFPPLKACQDRARALLDQVAASHPSDLPREAMELASGEHPFASLLIVVAGIESLSDAQWAVVHARVSEAFGRQLAVAAARGRLVVAPA